MEYKKGDYVSLLERIGTAVEKQFTDRQVRTLTAEFEHIGWEAAYRVSSRIERAANVPRNVYGMVLSMIDEESDISNKKTLTREDWKNDPDCASPEEYEMTMKCIAFSCMFTNSVEMCNILGEGMKTSIKKDCLLTYLKTFYMQLSDIKKNNPESIRKNMPLRIE